MEQADILFQVCLPPSLLRHDFATNCVKNAGWCQTIPAWLSCEN